MWQHFQGLLHSRHCAGHWKYKDEVSPHLHGAYIQAEAAIHKSRLFQFKASSAMTENFPEEIIKCYAKGSYCYKPNQKHKLVKKKSHKNL